MKLKVKSISPLVAPAYARARRSIVPMLGPVFRRIRHRNILPEDSFVACYPRSGNTWLRFMLYEALTGESADFHRVRPAMPHVNPYSDTKPLFADGGRLFLTHEQYCDYYRNGRAVYLVRDVKDVVISEYGRQLMNQSYGWDFDRFLEDFLRGRLHRFGTWADHVNSWLNSEVAKKGDLYLARYEDLKSDPEGVLGDLLGFLGEQRDLLAIREAVQNNTLKAMRQKEDRNQLPEAKPGFRFVNEGASGGWRHKLADDQIFRIDQAFGNVLERLGYREEIQKDR